LGAAELRRLARRESGRVCQRVLMIANLLEGMEHEEAARLAGLSRSAAYEWHNRYEEDGIEGLRDRPRPGRQPRVDAVTSARFKERIVAGAELELRSPKPPRPKPPPGKPLPRKPPPCASAVPAAINGARAITTMATIFNNLRVMRPSYSLPPSYHSRFEGIYAGPRRGSLRQNEMSDSWNTSPLPPVWKSDWAVAADAVGNGQLNRSVKPKLEFAHRIHYGAGWNKRRRVPVSIGVARQARGSTSNGDPREPVYRPALALAST
jgi:hypothetical protein